MAAVVVVLTPPNDPVAEEASPDSHLRPWLTAPEMEVGVEAAAERHSRSAMEPEAGLAVVVAVAMPMPPMEMEPLGDRAVSVAEEVMDSMFPSQAASDRGDLAAGKVRRPPRWVDPVEGEDWELAGRSLRWLVQASPSKEAPLPATPSLLG